MPIHDVECKTCGTRINNYYRSPWPDAPIHEGCGGPLEIRWQPSTHRVVTVNQKERTVIYQHPITGEVAYPGRADVPMPAHYRNAGFQRVEFEHARDLETFERTTGTVNEALWFNSGNGCD
jgi:hypothetical protein